MAEPSVNPTSTWDAARYTSTGAFVAELAGDVLAALAARPGEQILDVGCGDGLLTARIRDLGAEVTGIDASASLVTVARSRGLQVIHADAAAMDFDREFDAVFSNAALHWMLDPLAVAAAMYRALRPGGRLAVEFGGFGNIAAISTGLRAVLRAHGITDLPADQYYPTAESYEEILQSVGFEAVQATIVPRPTRLADGMAAWLTTFRGGLFDALGLDEPTRADVIADTCALLAPALLDPTGQWWADYVRIRVNAMRQAGDGDEQAPSAPLG